ncbi:MAG TPA: glycerol-3-phosphate dehydrogenase, partial [Myxococcota bacterium]|nr:glycerol-3-phosphate dehydrogenase [Myxococcota bacterium]
MPSQREMWDRLGGEADLLVVGGGITGTGIARDAAMRGLRVVLVEAVDFAYGTSSRSSKLVHGGLRYLEQRELGLVFEAVSERRILMDIAPHLVHPLGFLFPVFKDSRQPLWMINAGLWLYDGLSLFRSPRIHQRYNARQASEVEPLLRTDGLQGAPLYYDCATDDARLTLENALDAARLGAVVVNRARVVGFLKDEAGRVRGAVVEDVDSGELKQVHAATVVNATGPWTDRVVALSAPPTHALLRPTKGIHIVVPHARLPVRYAVVVMHPGDGRVLFAIPWGDQTYVGTTDTDFEGDPADVAATAEDVDYLIAAVNAYFPTSGVTRDDVQATWAGLRPLIAPPSDEALAESSVSREHAIIVGQDGLITIAGGKLTTYRRMAAEVVDTAVKLLRLTNRLQTRLQNADTDSEPLPGAVGWPEDDDPSRLISQVKAVGGERMADDTARHLVSLYGTRALDLAKLARDDDALAERLAPGRPEIMAQVDHAVREELAGDVADVMVRRTQVFYRSPDQGLGATDRVAARMAALLGWSEARAQASADAYRDEVA